MKADKLKQEQQIKNDMFVEKLLEMQKDNSSTKRQIVEYLLGYFLGLNEYTDKQVDELKNSSKKKRPPNQRVVNTEVDINEIIHNFLKNGKLQTMSFEDAHNGINFSITYEDYHKNTLILFFKDRIKGIELKITRPE